LVVVVVGSVVVVVGSVVVVVGSVVVVVGSVGSVVVVVGSVVVVVGSVGSVVVVVGSVVVVVGSVVVVVGSVVVGSVVVVVVGGVLPAPGQPADPMTLSSRVTAPSRASTRPCTDAPVCTVIEASAMTVPTKSVPVPRVAELPTCQNTLQAFAPFTRETLLLEAVISVESAWKIHTAPGMPWPSRVSVPVRPRVALW
jgi:hypothetical protein